jgi:hypothetical protein
MCQILEMRKAYNLFVENGQGRHGVGFVGIYTFYLKGDGCKGQNWHKLAQKRIQQMTNGGEDRTHVTAAQVVATTSSAYHDTGSVLPSDASGIH